MEILAPTVVPTFLQELHILDHSTDAAFTLQVASFELLLSIKQRICMHATDPIPYLPPYLFLAVKNDDETFTPIEFQYVEGFERPNRLPDPLTTPPPDRRFVTEEGSEIPISQESYKGLTVDQIPFQTDHTLHIWTLRSLAAAADPKNVQQFIGYFQVYFPQMTQPQQVEETLYTSMTRDMTDTYARLQEVQKTRQATLTRMEHSITSFDSIQLNHSTRFHAALPPLHAVETEGLDIVFHALKGSRFIPFVRYFPSTGSPILKLSASPSGLFYITNAAIFRLFLMDIPDVEQGSVLMIKCPIEPQDVRIVQKGFAWTFLIYSDGRAEVRLDAYRSNEPIQYTLLEDAFKQLPSILSSIGWSPDAARHMHLSLFSGVYEVDSERDVSTKELQRRVKQYSAFLFEETTAKTNGVILRSRIGQFSPQEDPFQRAMDLYSLNRLIDIKQFTPLLLREFGIPVKQIAEVGKRFLARNQERIELYGEAKPTPSEELGATLFIENESPRFRFKFEHVQSMKELQQLLTIANSLLIGGSGGPAVEPAAAPPARTLSILDAADNTATNEDNAFAALQEEEEPALPPANKDTYNYIDYLIKADYNLFKFTAVESLKIGAYTTSCQRSAHRQPYVVSPNKYKDIKEKYEDRVHILEYPLSDYNTEVVKFVSSTAQERRKNKKSKKEKEAMELHGLRLGVPLEGNVSFMGNDASPRLKELVLEQQRKELWVIARAGSDPKKPNYYICSKLWCATDQIPVLQADYEGPLMRNGTKKKLIPSCPFCGEQNVIERKGDHIYVGYFNDIKHPKRYNLPCCFKTPGRVDLPKGGIPIPDPPKGLEPVYPAPEQMGEEVRLQIERLKDLAAAFRKVQSSSTYILRSSTSLTDGTIGLVPGPIDTLLGQSSESYTTTAKGNVKLTGTPHAFIRFGIYGDAHRSGQNFLQFLSYILFVTTKIGHGVAGIPPNSMLCPTDILRWIVRTRMVDMARALEAANYGTLIREFYDPEEADPGTAGSPFTALEFQTWMGQMKLGSADRAHVLRFFKAWKRFVAYLSDPYEPKELRIWDGLLSAPGLFSKDGVVILRVVPEYAGSKLTKGDLKCPPFGISKRTQEGSPCIIPIYYTEEHSIIEPLIYVENTTHYIGAIHPTAVSTYSRESRKKILDLYSQTLQPILGCGRPIPPVHPWFFVNKHIIQVGVLLDFFKNKSEYTVKSILRERTNRIVGVVVEAAEILYYIPTSDDGTIDTRIVSSYDLDALPIPSYPHAFEFFKKLSRHFSLCKPSNIRYINDKTGKKIFTQIELAEHIFIPIEPFQETIYPVTLPPVEDYGISSREEDTLLLQQADKESMKLMKEVEINPEELLEEAYQYLRLSFSNWLIREGHKVAVQIELLRAARNRFPLYELRKRGDILLHSLIRSWLTTDGESTIPPLLRQDCMALKEGECSGICSWSEGRCKIHTPVYGTVADPASILTARLVDELLRTNGPAYEVLQRKGLKVSRLRPPTGIVREEGTIVLSVEGRGDAELDSRLGFDERHATAYTRGYRYPEEISAEDLGREIATESGLPLAWEDAGWSRSGELVDIVRRLPELRDANLRELLLTAEGSKLTYTAFEKELQRLRPSHSTEPFNWSEEDLRHFSTILEVNIILTNKQVRTGMLEFKTLLPHKSAHYLLFDSDLLPLLYTPSGEDPLHYVDFYQLPEDVQVRIELL